MLSRLSLRLRIFLFFGLILAASLIAVAASLWLGFQRSGASASSDGFVFAAILSSFGLLAVTASIWLLFDENVAKPIERIAADMRTRAHAGVPTALDQDVAKYLGDLAPAAAGLAGQLSQANRSSADLVAAETTRLNEERCRLTALLSEIPLAILVIDPNHRIVLYDSQAASVLAQVAPPRLHAPIFDYLDKPALSRALDKVAKSGFEVPCPVPSHDGAQTFQICLKPLSQWAHHGLGHMIILEDSQANLSPDAARPLVFDFDPTQAEAPHDLMAADLASLGFVVFDTETTGLLPHKDEIVQLGAVRVLRGRMVAAEQMDQLVNPGCPIPAASTRVHGVSDLMVRDAPGIQQVGRVFHHFAKGSVIVAHNAPFDMAFLRRHAASMGVNWDQPVLDTVLLSAVLFGASQTHTLDALCDRLDVTIPAALRHTALGDARATAEVLCKMLPMLEARGMTTLGAVIAETRRHGRLLEDLN